MSDLAERLARLSPEQRARLQRAMAAQRPAPVRPAMPRRAAGEVRLPLTPAQERLWFFEQLQPGSGAYHVYAHHRLRGELDEAALAAALAELVRRQEALRTSFHSSGGRPWQEIEQEVAPDLERFDLSAVPGEEREARARELLTAFTHRPFALERAPLLRAALLTLGPAERWLALVTHHLVSDAWSRGVLLDELAALYGAFAAGRPSPLPEPAAGWGDCLLLLQQQAAGERAPAAVERSRRRLAGAPALLELPADRARPPVQSFRGASHFFTLPGPLAGELTSFAGRRGATAYMVLLAAFGALLSRLARQTDLVIGTPVANRPLPETEGVVGLFVNTVALRIDLDGDPTFDELLGRVRGECLAVFDEASTPFERVVEALQLERSASRTPLFQVMFVYQDVPSGGRDFPGLEREWVDVEATSARFDLTLSMGPDERCGSIGGLLDYASDLFDAATAERWMGHFCTLLAAAVARPQTRLSALPLLTADERRGVLALGCGAEQPRPAGATLHGLFQAQAARTPTAVAVATAEGEHSYGELEQRANGLAWRLCELGVESEERVGLLADRTADAVAAVLGILTAGAAYLPLGADVPIERLVSLFADAGVRVVVADAAGRRRLAGLRYTLIAAEAPLVAAAPPPVAVSERALAYVIYTSGSSGRPKGVLVEHRSAVNLALGFAEGHGFAGHRVLVLPPLAFDASVGDLFPALAAGASLVFHPNPAELDGAALGRLAAALDVTAIDAPAALWRRWVEEWSTRHDDPLPGVRLMMVGGESVPVAAVRRFAELTGRRVAFFNHYGPTEATVCSTLFATRDAGEVAAAELPIGRPLPNVAAHVLDERLEPLPAGVPGALYLGGAGVARGYLGRPEATAASFVADPFAGRGARLYRTGDQARWLPDGNLEFLGRGDQQVKLRGFRVELGEVEAALAAHPAVRGAAVAVREVAGGSRLLVAYLVADGEASALAPELAAEELRAFLGRRLPDYMLPAAYVQLPALPLTSNGKVDRAALPPPPAAALRAGRPLVAPRTTTERAVAAVFAALLGLPAVGAEDDFFLLGGDSLATIPLLLELERSCGVRLALTDVFQAPQVAALATRLDAARRGDEPAAAEVDLDREATLPADVAPAEALPPVEPPRTVLLTGATGFLGAFLLAELLRRSDARVLCLVRAAGVEEARRRLAENLERYGFLNGAGSSLTAALPARVVALPGDLASPHLGLDDETYDALAREVDLVIHNGGTVSFAAPYERLKPANVTGTLEVLRLASRFRRKPVHLLSTLGVCAIDDNLGRTVRESDPPPGAAGQAGGYNQSKWVAERLALEARRRGLPVTVYRPARIAGASDSGSGNAGDFFSSWIRSCIELGAAPAIAMDVDLAPVDCVARAVVALALTGETPLDVCHLYNGYSLSWAELVDHLQARGWTVRSTSYAEWRRELLAAGADNALAPFASLFPPAFDTREPRFDCSATFAALAAHGVTFPTADRQLLDRYLDSFLAAGYLPAPRVERALAAELAAESI